MFQYRQILNLLLFNVVMLSALSAQPPVLVTIKSDQIKIKYHAPINASTANASNLKIWGDETGQRTGTYTTSLDTVIFTPATPFRAGELLHITSRSGLQFTGGNPTTPFSWVRQAAVSNPTAVVFDTIGTGIILPVAAYGSNAAYQSTTADVNRDGRQDLIYRYHVGGGATNILVYIRNANGSFAAPVTYSNTESYSGLIGTPDLNNDGFPDLIVMHNLPSSIQVRLNNGVGGFGSASFYAVTDYCNGAKIADIDSDGDLDIIAFAGNSSLSLNTISLLKNNGDGTFATHVTTNTSVFGTSCQLVDFDNDGDMDVFYTSNSAFGSAKTFKVYTNNGTGSFNLFYDETNNAEKSIISAFDFDGNQTPDIITRNPNTEIHLANSGLSYTLNTPSVLDSQDSWTLTGDLDGDGDLDILSSNRYNGSNWNTLPMKIHLNNGSGSFVNVTSPMKLPNIWPVDLTDYDSDGDLDHIYLNFATGEIKVLLNNCSIINTLTIDHSPLSGTYHAAETINVVGNVSVSPNGNVLLSAPLVKVSNQFNPGNLSNVTISPEGCATETPFVCGTSTVTFTYNGSPVTYGTVVSAGRCWLDRNLGASQVATSSTDAAAYGDLFQWGREADGHQIRNPLSGTTSTLSSTDSPGHGLFITTISGNYDWRSPQNNNLWQGVNGVNNPCPSGYRVPTAVEMDTERASWGSNQNAVGAFASPLKLPIAGFRSFDDGSVNGAAFSGVCWSSSVDGIYSRNLFFGSGFAVVNSDNRANGFSLRCIKDEALPLGSIGSLNCAGATITGTLSSGVVASGVSASVPYAGGNGGTHSGQTVTSSGVTGLTATLSAGSFVSGPGSLTYSMTGTPASAGTAVFALNIGGQMCSLSVPIGSGTFTCGTSTVTFTYNGSPVTYGTVVSAGRCWLDRNLGASQVATSSTDAAAYGDLFQWGRGADGHQIRNPLSGTTSTLSSTDNPGHGLFITTSNQPLDWRSPQNNNLWQGVAGINNPCPTGFRVPTSSELDTERLSWSGQNAAGAFISPLKLPAAFFRTNSGDLPNPDGRAFYWSSSVTGGGSTILIFGVGSSILSNYARAPGYSLRCIKDEVVPVGSIGSINCTGATNNGIITAGTPANGVSSVVSYTSGNGGTHSGQTVSSTGVTGLTATLTVGTFANGSGSLTYNITGTPASSGTASFALNIGGQSCTLNITVAAGSPSYPVGYVHCNPSNPTAIVEVLNPTTNKIWMDRNLGANRVATSSTDTEAFGSLFQWGRGADGHQCVSRYAGDAVTTSGVTTILSSIDMPGNGDFILAPIAPNDWRSPQNNDLWQGINGLNNPCPSGYRLPTETELNVESTSWSSQNAAGAYASPLKLPMAGFRFYSSGSLIGISVNGRYWSSTVNVNNSSYLNISSAILFSDNRSNGYSLRCIKDEDPPIQGSIGSLNCAGATNNGTLTSGTSASGVNSVIPYTGGNGGTHNGQTVTSTGVTGLTATLAAGTFSNGSGSLTYTITGIPVSSGTASFALSIGGQNCTLTRTVNLPVGTIATLNCAGATYNGNLTAGTVASGVSSIIPYTGGNGGTHNGQTVTSTGVTGLTAILGAGSFVSGSGSLTYSITGTPASVGTSLFALNIGGQSCSLSVTVASGVPSYPSGYVHCNPSNPTAIIEVLNPTTNKIWMDRNLGANRVAINSTDTEAYGSLIQWGRGADGHQCVNRYAGDGVTTSGTTTTLSSTDNLGHGDFIKVNNSPYDWRSPQNTTLWQGVNGVNNPCPSEYRLPTNSEFDAERASWSSQNATGAFGSPLKLSKTGYRDITSGMLNDVGNYGLYWTSTVSNTSTSIIYFTNSSASMTTGSRGTGISTRCIKDSSPPPGSIGSLDCAGATIAGTLTSGLAASGVSASVPYTGGNGGTHSGQTVTSTGVTGLTTTMAAGSFVSGSGSLTYTITGTPATAGTALFALNIGGQSCSLSVTVAAGSIATLNCAGTTITGTLISGLAASGVSAAVPYTGGNGGTHSGQTVTSTGVMGLTATLAAGSFASGSGSLTYTITGTPASAGTASFALNIGGHSCTLHVTVTSGTIASLNCAGATITGTLTSGLAASSVSAAIPYTGGNGGTHSGQTMTSTGVTGLTAILPAGSFASGSGSLTYTITGTTASAGTASFALNIGGQSCTLNVVVVAGSITSLNCSGATIMGTLTSGVAASGVSAAVPYTDGNGGTHSGQTVASTGVTGLTANLPAGSFATGSSSLTYTITGTPASAGTASFALNIGGQSCSLSVTVAVGGPSYPSGYVHCNPSNPTAIVEVLNPATNKIWMDRNLGANRAATSSTDAEAYGSLFQWGRKADGHQCVNRYAGDGVTTSGTTTTLSSTDTPTHGLYIRINSGNNDWRSPQNNNLWQGLNGVNNPCPSGYRLPTETELDSERSSWSSNNSDGSFASPLQLSSAGYRNRITGSLVNVGTNGYYWSSTINSTNSRSLTFDGSNASIPGLNRAFGESVRCIKE